MNFEEVFVSSLLPQDVKHSDCGSGGGSVKLGGGILPVWDIGICCLIVSCHLLCIFLSCFSFYF